MRSCVPRSTLTISPSKWRVGSCSGRSCWATLDLIQCFPFGLFVHRTGNAAKRSSCWWSEIYSNSVDECLRGCFSCLFPTLRATWSHDKNDSFEIITSIIWLILDPSPTFEKTWKQEGTLYIRLVLRSKKEFTTARSPLAEFLPPPNSLSHL